MLASFPGLPAIYSRPLLNPKMIKSLGRPGTKASKIPLHNIAQIEQHYQISIGYSIHKLMVFLSHYAIRNSHHKASKAQLSQDTFEHHQILAYSQSGC